MCLELKARRLVQLPLHLAGLHCTLCSCHLNPGFGIDLQVDNNDTEIHDLFGHDDGCDVFFQHLRW